VTGHSGTRREVPWTEAEPGDYPALPYPGTRPSGSWWLAADQKVRPLEYCGGDTVRDLATGETKSLAGRILILAYGSNACPEKLAQRYSHSDVFALSADVEDWAAVWCSSRRQSGDVVCTIAPFPGARERHAVLAVTPGQLGPMDEWEGHPSRYQRGRFTGRVILEDGSSPEVEVYLGTPDKRPTLLVDGQPLLCGSVSYAEVDRLVARP
jgi:hypothetical protein